MADGDITLEWYVTAVGDTIPLAAACQAEATVLVNHHIGTRGSDVVNPHGVPQEMIDRAILEVGADLYYRRAARNGIVQFGSGIEAASVVRINRDPMTQAYEILRPFLPLGFA